MILFAYKPEGWPDASPRHAFQPGTSAAPVAPLPKRLFKFLARYHGLGPCATPRHRYQQAHVNTASRRLCKVPLRRRRIAGYASRRRLIVFFRAAAISG